MESIWNLYGIYMESIWNLYGIYGIYGPFIDGLPFLNYGYFPMAMEFFVFFAWKVIEPEGLWVSGDWKCG